jgi:hypothetical protein
MMRVVVPARLIITFPDVGESTKEETARMILEAEATLNQIGILQAESFEGMEFAFRIHVLSEERMEIEEEKQDESEAE